MPGTKAGAKKAADTRRRRYGKDVFSKIGSKGGQAGAGSFAYDSELASRAGRKGGHRTAENRRKRALGEA